MSHITKHIIMDKHVIPLSNYRFKVEPQIHCPFLCLDIGRILDFYFSTDTGKILLVIIGDIMQVSLVV